MDAQLEMDDGLLVAAGTLDLYAAEALRDGLLQILEQSAEPKLQLTGVESCDVACLQLLCAAARTAAAQGTPLAVAGRGEAVEAACRLLGTTFDEMLQGGR